MDLSPLFRSVTETENHPAGTKVFAKDDAADHMYVVKEGVLELLINDVVIESVQSGGVFGEMALIDKGVRSATARVKEDCVLVTVDERQFAFLCQQTPYFALQMMRLLVSRIRKMDSYVKSENVS
ncbi:MAG: cyclic nucleotide-binding domain-containing protein [Opitutales bacterium]